MTVSRLKLLPIGFACAVLTPFIVTLAFGLPALPNINTNNVITVTNAPYNAKGDGLSTNTAAIQTAISAAATGGTVNGLSGGTVRIPGPGVYLCGPITLANNVNLQVDAGAILRMLPFGQYPVTWFTNGTTIYFTANNFIYASSLHDIEISGSGIIDGQGQPWWPWAKTNGAVRPIMLRLENCNRELIQNITLSNSPMFHISVSGSRAGNTTVQGVTIRAPSSSANPPSHNTDACDVDGTNILVQNCDISVGDDNFTCGGNTFNVLVTNNVYGSGHGVSIGSYTDGGVSNITVVNCSFTGTDNGIRIKSDNGRGGLVQNISYYNLKMTNVHFPIQVYGYYTVVGTPSSITPYYAATQAVTTVTSSSKTPIYRNLTFSNITATSSGNYPAIILWPRAEARATNIVFNRVNISANRPVEIYNSSDVQIIDSSFTLPSTVSTFNFYDSEAILSNSIPTDTLWTVDGLTTNGYGNSMSLFNTKLSLRNTNVFDDGPLTLSGSTLIISNNLKLTPSTGLNYVLGTNAATISVSSNLVLGGNLNITTGAGFTNGTYTLLTYTKNLGGVLPALGIVPAGYDFSFDTNTAGQVNLNVEIPLPPAPTHVVATGTNSLILLHWSAVPTAESYKVKRSTSNDRNYPVIFSGLTATNYSDLLVTNGTIYYYVVSAVGAGGESTNSLPVSATPQPSLVPPDIISQIVGNQLQLSWPSDHIGWELQIQTNNLSSGIGTNWVTIANSSKTNQITIPVTSTNGAVFLRMFYP